MKQQRAELFLECLWNLVIRNRTAAGLSGSPFNLAELHVLVNLLLHQSATISEIGSYIQQDQGTTSRIVSKLADQGYIDKLPNPADSRSTLLRAAESTQAMFRELESGYNQRSEQIYSRLAPAEREVLYSGFDQIGDFRGVPPSPLRSDEHPSRPPIRRYTVAIGFLGRGLLDTSLSSTLWMILESIKRLPAGQCTPAHLSELLGITRSTMTYSLKTLAGLDAIEKTVDESDSRSYWLSLNSKGEQLRDQVKEAAVGFLDGAFGERNTDEQDFFLATYLKVIGGAAEAQLKVLIDLNLNKKAAASQASGDTLSIEFSQATTSEELQAARAFALRTLVNSNLAHKAPAGIADDKSMSFTARLSNQILGFIQVSSKPTQQVELLLCEPLVAEVLGASLIQRARAVLKVPDGQEMRVPLVTNC